MHKIVNGIRIELTAEEEKVIQDEWIKNAEGTRLKKESIQMEAQKLNDLKNSVSLKLKSLGLTDEEIKLMMDK